MNTLRFLNRQKTRKFDLRVLRRMTRYVLETELGLRAYELGVHLVAAPEMTHVNETFLGHPGSTDVITFDNLEPGSDLDLCGELYISIDDAILQAAEFKTTWQSELARYVVHGILHLRGYDDLKPDLRRVMKREENRLVARLRNEIDLL